MNMTYIKTACSILFLSIVVGGCSTSKKAVSFHHTRTDDRTQVDSSRISEGRHVMTSSSVQNMIEEMRNGKDIRIVFFDTSKPADPQTGRSPVLAEATIRDSTLQTRICTKEDTTAQTEAVREELIGQTKYDIKTESDTEEHTEHKNRQTWIYIVGAIVALLLLWITRRFIRSFWI